VFFVALAPLATPSAVVVAIATALGPILQGSDPRQALLQTLHDKRCLLLLDNFEHVMDGVEIVVDLLQAAPHVQLLATSREQLNVRGEHLYFVQAMDYAPDATLADATTSSAVRLFVQSAHRAQPDWTLNAANVVDVLQICQLVQGMPLGLELAAAWANTLPLHVIAAEIAHSADFLASEWRDAPVRQRSMRAIFDWSWRLLNDTERQVLRHISVFRGGFTREAAQAVVGVSLRVLMGLQRKSLLYRGASGRYEMHELLRQFAAAHLDAAPDERAAVEARHSEFYLAFVAAREKRLARNEPQEAAAEIRSEIDNVRQAWTWGAAQTGGSGLDTCAFALAQYYMFSGLMVEGEAAFRLAAERIHEQLEQATFDEQRTRNVQNVLSTLLGIRGSFLIAQGKHDQALTTAEQAIAWGQGGEDVEGEVFGYLVKGQALRRQGYSSDARVLLEHVIVLARRYQRTDTFRESLPDIERRAYGWLCSIALTLDDYPTARSYAEQGLQVCRALGKLIGEMISLTDIVDIAKAMGDYPAARRDCEQVLLLAHKLEFRWGEAMTQIELGDIVRLQGDYALAYKLFEQGLALSRETGQPVNEAYAAVGLGRLNLCMGNYAHAQEWLDQYFQIIRGLDIPARELFLGLLPLALLAHATGNDERALGYAEQGWQMAQELDGRSSQAYALVILGRVYTSLGRSHDAATAYEEALMMYDALGHVHKAAEARAGLACVTLNEGGLAQALMHVEAIWTVLGDLPYVGLDEPFDIYLTCYRVLHANHDARAVSILQTAQRRLREYVDHITDAALRQSFLHNVATHRALASAASGMTAVPSPVLTDERVVLVHQDSLHH
jgi:predicted ATPase